MTITSIIVTHTEDNQVGIKVLLLEHEDDVGEQHHEIEESGDTRSQVRVSKEYAH